MKKLTIILAIAFSISALIYAFLHAIDEGNHVYTIRIMDTCASSNADSHIDTLSCSKCNTALNK